MSTQSVKKHTFHEVKQCARCGQTHKEIEFFPFISQPVVDEDGTVWDHWGFCPQTSDPILLHSGEVAK